MHTLLAFHINCNKYGDFMHNVKSKMTINPHNAKDYNAKVMDVKWKNNNINLYKL